MPFVLSTDALSRRLNWSLKTTLSRHQSDDSSGVRRPIRNCVERCDRGTQIGLPSVRKNGGYLRQLARRSGNRRESTLIGRWQRRAGDSVGRRDRTVIGACGIQSCECGRMTIDRGMTPHREFHSPSPSPLLAGAPEGFQPVGAWDTREEAEKALAETRTVHRQQ